MTTFYSGNYIRFSLGKVLGKSSLKKADESAKSEVKKHIYKDNYPDRFIGIYKKYSWIKRDGNKWNKET